MNNLRSNEESKDLFGKLGLEVTHDHVEIGKIYPIFGAITAIRCADGNKLEIEINRNIIAHLSVSSAEKIETLKARAFESGIFISKVVAIEPTVTVECQTVIFGKNQAASC